MLNTAQILLIIGVVAVGGYFVINSTSNASSSCAGNWTDAINPFCIFGSAVDNAENEVNTILIIVALMIVLVVGLLAFGTQTGNIAAAAGKFAL